MKAYSQTEPKPYAVSGNELRIHWNIEQVTAPDMEGKDQKQWVANEALAFVHDTRDILIEKVIGSIYTVKQELAIINNHQSDPQTYADYQELRAKAKTLADGWLAQKGE